MLIPLKWHFSKLFPLKLVLLNKQDSYTLIKIVNMDTLKKFELMEKIVRELEDLQHSQQAIIQKIGKIEVDNIELGDKKLDKDLPDMHQRVADNLDSIIDILAYFADKTQNFGNKNNVDALKEQQSINEATGH